jgi:hypothetical protein
VIALGSGVPRKPFLLAGIATIPATLQLNVPAHAMYLYTDDFLVQFPFWLLAPWRLQSRARPSSQRKGSAFILTNIYINQYIKSS